MQPNPVLYSRQNLRHDWRRRLERALESDGIRSTVQALCRFQSDHALTPTGFVDTPTRLLLIRAFPELALQIVGPHTEEHVIVDESQSETQISLRIESILEDCSSDRFDLDDFAQILAIRGVRRCGKVWRRTSSAAEFLSQPCGARLHFSSAKSDYNDSLFAVLWREQGARRVRIFSGTVNPNAIWPAGTSHLAAGQYFFKIGRHRTRDIDHIQSVEAMSPRWPSSWIFDRASDSIQYLALEMTSPVEVIRSTGESLDISDEDIWRAEQKIAEQDPAFTDTLRIKINIHTCAPNHASSLGCQNIRPDDYADFMNILSRCAENQRKRYGFSNDIAYTLVDSSFIHE